MVRTNSAIKTDLIAFAEIPLESIILCQGKWIYRPDQCQDLFEMISTWKTTIGQLVICWQRAWSKLGSTDASSFKRVFDKTKNTDRRLTAEERKLHKQTSLNEWQKRSNETTKACIKKNHGETDYYLTQLLTRYDCFREYLYKYGHDDRYDCSFCRNGPENAWHIIFLIP